jgi:hypothetical protein
MKTTPDEANRPPREMAGVQNHSTRRIRDLLVSRRTGGGAPVDRSLDEKDRTPVERAVLFRDYASSCDRDLDTMELIQAERERLSELKLYAVTDQLPDRLAHLQRETGGSWLTMLCDEETGELIGCLTQYAGEVSLYTRRN